MKVPERWLRRDHHFILAVADTHVLGGCGLAPRGWVTNAGNKIELNKAQNYLADCFDHLLGAVPRYIDSLFLVGDIMEGKNIFDFGVDLSEVDEDWQVRGATVVTVPAFKVQDPFAQGGKTPNRTIPDALGAVGFKVYNEPVDGKLVHVIPYLYDHPDDEPEVI
jgi:hypothetical protein